MIPVQTPQQLLALGGLASFAFALAFAVVGVIKLTLASIGDLNHEAHPLLAAVGWLHRASERIWPVVGRHVRSMLDDDEQEEDGGQSAETPACDRQPLPAADDPRGEAPLVDQADEALPARRQPEDAARAPGERPADDLITGDDYDTDTLRVFQEANAEHLVPSHEPETSAAVPAHTRRDHGDDPGPDGPPDTIPPGVAAGETSGPGNQPALQPGGESGEPGAQAAACRPFRRLPAADLDPLTWIIARHLDAPAEMLAEWESQIAEHLRDAMTALRTRPLAI